MHWIGLTGGIGSGKSTVADLFMQLQVPVIDADTISKELTASNGLALPLIQEQLGSELVVDGVLNRTLLRERVFADIKTKRRLESILHPLIHQQILNQQQIFDGVYGLVDIPLLTELPIFQSLIEKILVVDCPTDIQIRRVMARSGLSHIQIKAIMSQQATREERLAIADDIILNDQDLHHLGNQVQMIHQRYLQLFQSM